MKLFEIVFLKQNCIVSKQSKRNNRIKNPFIKPLTKWTNHVWAHLGGSSAGVTSILQIIWSLTVTKACIIQLCDDQYKSLLLTNMQMQYTELLHQHQRNWKSSGMILPLSIYCRTFRSLLYFFLKRKLRTEIIRINLVQYFHWGFSCWAKLVIKAILLTHYNIHF